MAKHATRAPPKTPAHSHVLDFRDLNMFICSWCPFGENHIRTLNDSIDSIKGVKSSLLTGKVDRDPADSEFTIPPRFTRVHLKDFDRHNWVNFLATIEIPEGFEQVEILDTFVTKSGYISYGLEMVEIENKSGPFPVDSVAVILADLLEDSSILMDSLLSQFQKRVLKMVYQNPLLRPKYVTAITSALEPVSRSATGYNDGEERQNEIDQIVGTSFKYTDLMDQKILILGTQGLILICKDFERFEGLLSLHANIQATHIFLDDFFARIQEMWDTIKDMRNELTNLRRESSIGELNKDLSEISTDIVIVNEIFKYLESAIHDVHAIWTGRMTALDEELLELASELEIETELEATGKRTEDMKSVSIGLQNEINGLRDLVSTLAEERMRELSVLMTDNVQSTSETQLSQTGILSASKDSQGALVLLSMITLGALGFQLANMAHSIFGIEPYLQILLGISLWLIFSVFFWWLFTFIRAKNKTKRLQEEYTYQIRIPIDYQVQPADLNAYLDDKTIKFSNINRNITRISWSSATAKARYTVMVGASTGMDHLHWLQVSTDSSTGDHETFVRRVMAEFAEKKLVPKIVLERSADQVGLKGVMV